MRNKKIAAILAFGLVLTTCSTPAAGELATKELIQTQTIKPNFGLLSFMKEQKIKQTILEKEIAERIRLTDNSLKLKSSIEKLKNTVGKTWYVFSGSTPSGWDCSGLVVWFYKQNGITLRHRASVQDDAGVLTLEPKLGDIVVFKYKGYQSAYHVGIYIGNNMMIHAPSAGKVTRIEDIHSFGGNYSEISFRRIIDAE